MARNARPKEFPTHAVERQLLSAMCSRRVSRKRIISTIDQLEKYSWLVPEHMTVFQAIRRAVLLGHASWRELLPAQATRMGFPDVEWSQYFAAGNDEGLSLDDLLTRLIARSKRVQRT